MHTHYTGSGEGLVYLPPIASIGVYNHLPTSIFILEDRLALFTKDLKYFLFRQFSGLPHTFTIFKETNGNFTLLDYD